MAGMSSLETDVVLLPEEPQHGVQDGGRVGRADGGVVLRIAGAGPHRHLRQQQQQRSAGGRSLLGPNLIGTQHSSVLIKL